MNGSYINDGLSREAVKDTKVITMFLFILFVSLLVFLMPGILRIFMVKFINKK